MSDDLLEASKKELADFQKKNESLVKQIREEYERAMREFENEYPPLKIVGKICFTQNELQESFLRLRKSR